MPLVYTTLRGSPPLQGVRQLEAAIRGSLAASRRPIATVVHTSNMPSAKHDLRPLPLTAHCSRRLVRERIVLHVPVEHELAVVHLADLALLLVDAEVSGSDRTEVVVRHGGHVFGRVGCERGLGPARARAASCRGWWHRRVGGCRPAFSSVCARACWNPLV